MPLRNVTHEHPAVRFELPAGPGLATFGGTHDGDSISGAFEQAGVSGTFALARVTDVGAAAPSTPPDPLPYREEEVTFTNGDLRFAGTLTTPDAPDPAPAVVLITGSGPQNRDEELFGFKPFRIIADRLTRDGIAVLRYDDRGVGGSTGSVTEATSDDFAGDVLAAVDFLRRRDDIDQRRIGLVGHSEGGIVAPIAANQSDRIAFVVLLAAPAMTGEEILYAQGELIARANGADEEALAPAA